MPHSGAENPLAVNQFGAGLGILRLTVVHIA